MKFTPSWLRDHLQTSASTTEIAEAMTMAGLEVESVEDPSAKLAPFTAARIVEAVQHPNADRLRVCQVDTVQGRLEIVCGAPNARAGLVTVFAPVGTYIPGTGITLEPRPVRGVVSNGMLCSAAELEVSAESDGIVELDPALDVGTPAAAIFGAEPVIDFEVTPNRPDWLGVQGIARDLAAAGLGRFTDRQPEPVAGRFPCPISVRIEAPELCPVFAGRLIRGVRNGPSPDWLQARLKAVGLKPISALVDVTQYLTFDRARPLHVYDAGKLVGTAVIARAGKPAPKPAADDHFDATRSPEHADEQLIALDGRTYDLTEAMCVIADAHGSRPIGLGGVMGGASTGCDETTTDVFIESAWFAPIATARTGRTLGLSSDAQYRFARGVDPGSVLPGLELATALILELCGGEPSEITVAGAPPEAPEAFPFDPAYVERLSGLSIPRARTLEILTALGFGLEDAGEAVRVQPPSWRRDVEGKADLVEEVARIQGYAALPSTPLPPAQPRPGGVLTPLQARARTARRALAAAGYQEAVTWSFTARDKARLFEGGQDALVVANPIASDLDCMRPSALPNLIEAAGRSAARGFPDLALFEIGPLYLEATPGGQKLAAAAVLAPHPPRRWDGGTEDPLFSLKADLQALLLELGAPTASLQVVQGEASSWWHPGRSASIKLGPKVTLAEFGELHPRVLKALDVSGPLYGFELLLGAIPEPRRSRGKTRPAPALSPLQPLTRDFAFVVSADRPAGDLVRAAASADKVLISEVRVFDVYRGPGVPEGSKSVALQVTLQPRDKTLTDAEIEALSARIVAAAAKLGAELRR
ncbi:MAG: phenylalanine--tRNA ligase subunit beta [Proteobacteria bacterium]|nr:phenylalanine--tRNA ligase subunit beta [Pseudomonadota bacterium]